MNDDYKQLRSQADKLFYRFNDRVDDKSAAAGLAREVRAVVEDFDSQRSPRSIDDRIKRITQQLRSLSGTVISDGDIDELLDNYEDLRSDLRNLPNY